MSSPFQGFGPLTASLTQINQTAQGNDEAVTTAKTAADKAVVEINRIITLADENATEADFTAALYTEFKGKTPL